MRATAFAVPASVFVKNERGHDMMTIYICKETRLSVVFASGIFMVAAAGHLLWSAARQRARPVAFCEEAIHDFGVAKSGDYVEHKFLIENRGRQPLFLDNVRTDCRCSATTVTTLSRQVVAPGSSATLTVGFSLQGVRGNAQTRILVETSDPQRPAMMLRLEGIAEYDLLLEPERIVFAAEDSFDGRAHTVKLSSRRNDVSFRVLRAHSDWDRLETKIETVASGSVYHIHSALPPLGRIVDRPDSVRVAVTTDHPAEPVIVIPITLPRPSM